MVNCSLWCPLTCGHGELLPLVSTHMWTWSIAPFGVHSHKDMYNCSLWHLLACGHQWNTTLMKRPRPCGTHTYVAPRQPPIYENLLARVYLCTPQSYLFSTALYHNNRLYWAAMYLAFFGFLRYGELTIPDNQPFGPTVHMSIQDVTMDTNPPGLSVHIKASKTDPFRHGVTLHLGQTSADLCPVAAMSDFLSIRGTSPGLWGLRSFDQLSKIQ